MIAVTDFAEPQPPAGPAYGLIVTGLVFDVIFSLIAQSEAE
ncbi:hypothetical protein [Mesorhizobium sp. 10.2.3]|nr:hypothetical protein [Mesorhizobium sp. 10.2.3]